MKPTHRQMFSGFHIHLDRDAVLFKVYQTLCPYVFCQFRLDLTLADLANDALAVQARELGRVLQEDIRCALYAHMPTIVTETGTISGLAVAPWASVTSRLTSTVYSA